MERAPKEQIVTRNEITVQHVLGKLSVLCLFPTFIHGIHDRR